MKIVSLGLFVCAVLVHGSASAQNDCRKDYLTDSFPCYMDTISWVEVSFQGGLLSKNKSRYEKLLRKRLRQKLPMIAHDIAKYEAQSKKNEWDDASIDMMRRAALRCDIWTAGDRSSTAILAECKLWGYGSYRVKSESEFESRYLASSSAREANIQVGDMLNAAVDQIALDFLDSRDKVHSRLTKAKDKGKKKKRNR